MKECTTHHFACDCREAHFKELLAQAEAMADSLQAIDKKQTQYSEPYSSYEIVEEALEAWQKFKESL